MARRTMHRAAEELHHGGDLERLVVDKRAAKRASLAKCRRRNRRYQRRLIADWVSAVGQEE